MLSLPLSVFVCCIGIRSLTQPYAPHVRPYTCVLVCVLIHVSLYVLILMSLYVSLYMCPHVYICAVLKSGVSRSHICVLICVSLYTCPCICRVCAVLKSGVSYLRCDVCMHACMHACIDACIDACMHACIYACIDACMHISAIHNHFSVALLNHLYRIGPVLSPMPCLLRLLACALQLKLPIAWMTQAA